MKYPIKFSTTTITCGAALAVGAVGLFAYSQYQQGRDGAFTPAARNL